MERSDIELMLCAQNGDLCAFQELTLRYREPLRRFFAALLLDSSQAEDCVQETFLRLWLLRQTYQPTGKFSTYLFQIGKHHLLNHRRKLRHETQHLPVEAVQEMAIPEQAQPEWIVMQRSRRMQMQQALAQLPPHLRAVMELRVARQSTYAEIARELQIPIGTAKSRHAEALRRLRQAFSEEG